MSGSTRRTADVKVDIPSAVSKAPPIVGLALRGPSVPLDAETRAVMEHRLGTDLSHVRVHADEMAAESARAVHAAAYTVGNSVVFGPGRFAPRTEEGRNLIAHELVHTLQQHGAVATASAGNLTMGQPDTAAEDEARSIAHAPPAFSSRPPGSHVPGAIPRQVLRLPAASSPVVVARQLESRTDEAHQASQEAHQASQEAHQASQKADKASRISVQASQLAGDALAMANAAMGETQLQELRDFARFRISTAFTDYVSACEEVKDSIYAAAKKDAEMAGMILDIFFGFAVPDISRRIVNAADNIPPDASTAAYRVALGLLNQDQLKPALTAAAKLTGSAAKSHSMELSKAADVGQFIEQLHTIKRFELDNIARSLGPIRDAVQLSVIIARFDPDLTLKQVYVQQIKDLTDRYQREVSPIGEKAFSYIEGATRISPAEAVWVRDGATKRLAVAHHYEYGGIFGFGAVDFYALVRWVDPDMTNLVIEKQIAVGGGIDIIDKSDLRESRQELR
jgi:hypothetical protein